MKVEHEEILSELIENVRAGSPLTTSGPFTTYGFGPDNLHFEGHNFDLLHTLSSSIAGSALESGGRDRDDVASLIVAAIRVGRTSGLQEATSHMDTELAMPLTTWKVGQSIRLWNPNVSRIGRTEILRSATDLPELGPQIDEWINRDHGLSYPMLVASVNALDSQSAIRMAEDCFEEALAVLTFASPGWGTSEPPRMVLGSTPSFRSGRIESYSPPFVDGSGWFGFGTSALERAARKDLTSRTDWEARVLTATRWYRRALVDTWPSAILNDCMIALEILFVKETSGSKKDKIADRVSTRFRLPTKSEDQLHAWLVALYDGRNGVVHVGEHYLQDTETADLRTLVYSSVKWASGHLDDDHSHDGFSFGACADIDLVLDI